MKRMLSAAVAAAILLGLAPGASSAEGKRLDMTRRAGGYLYFNKPGANLAVHDADLTACIAVSSGGFTLDPNSSINPGGLLGHAMGGAGVYSAEKGRRAANVEHCMVARGWRVVRIKQREGERLMRVSRQALVETLTPWIGAETPQGEIVRTWENDLLRVETNVIGQSMAMSGEVLDQVALGPDAKPDPVQMVQGGIAIGVQAPSGGTPLLAEDVEGPVSGIPEGRALVIYRVSGARKYGRTFFLMQGADAESSGDPGFALQLLPNRRVKGDHIDHVGAVIVDPGRWRIRHFRGMVDFCFGSPAVDIKAGDVIYLGGFVFGPEPMRPDLSLEPARAALAAAPDLAARVAPARWVNGSRGPCGLWFNYALEFPGAPYEPGYAWGGAAG